VLDEENALIPRCSPKELLVELAQRNMRKISAEVVIALQNHFVANCLAWPVDGAPARKTKRK
jgi:hypothetical protein